VTYYTGKPDQVPHVPEMCMAGSGHRQISDELIHVPMPYLGEGATIPVRLQEYERESLMSRSQRIVMYTFHANGDFRSGRQSVRFALGDPRVKYAYFSKLEIGMDLGREPGAYASKTEAVEAGTRFLQMVIPVLLQDHWPDWEALEHD
jgi:hypothetical protein